MSGNKIIPIGEVIKIEVCRLTYKKQLERNALIRKFLPALPPDATPEDNDLRTARWNLIAFGVQTVATEGIEFEPVHPADEPDEFERKFELFLNNDDEVIRLWLTGIDGINKPLVPRAQLPEGMLSEEERKDPKSAASAQSQRTKSAKPSSAAPLRSSA